MMNIHQVEFSAQGSEMTLPCKRREGVSQLSWKHKNENIDQKNPDSLMCFLNLSPNSN